MSQKEYRLHKILKAIVLFCGDYAFYRLPWVYLSLAEIANMESDHSGIEKYINLVRKRAYASNWDENKHGYKSGEFYSK